MKIINYNEDLDLFKNVNEFLNSFQNQETFTFKTSGTTSKPKEIFLTKNQLLLSAQNTIDFLKIKSNDILLLCLDIAFIGAKMQIIRCLNANASLLLSQPQAEKIVNITHKIDFASYVPLQLKKIIESNNGINFLNNHKAILIGGANINEELIINIENLQVPVYQTFGMTETASHFAIKLLNTENKTDYYQTFPSVEIGIDENNCIKIKSNITNNEWIQTTDIVEILDNQRFKWIGRNDFIINSGGIKINPEVLEKEIEKIFIQNEINIPFLVSSIKDNLLGESLVLVIESKKSDELENKINNFLNNNLQKYYRPKKIVFITNIPFNLNGKIQRNNIKAMIS